MQIDGQRAAVSPPALRHRRTRLSVGEAHPTRVQNASRRPYGDDAVDFGWFAGRPCNEDSYFQGKTRWKIRSVPAVAVKFAAPKGRPYSCTTALTRFRGLSTSIPRRIALK